MYHNSTESTGPELREYRLKTQKQDEAVLAFFRNGGAYTPSEVWRRLFAESVPLTSVRRAMTNLTDRGLLVKTGRQRQGIYGRPEFIWTRPYQQGELFQ